MDELIEKLRAVTSLDEIAGLADAIFSNYADFAAGSEANSTELNKTITDLKAEVQRLQAENYKLLTANGQDIEEGEGTDTNEEEDIEIIDNLSDVIDED